ncbi:uncharacterized protein LOC131166314 [Malania oleifera]|uniref:uncharacterized protein LOC131166314 n=1 Tax=Malania oleifera TaxID=397392 RepID=UPI0025AE48E7|nr:uncharacterized protein LOC131166314 [Malania oleifera]
MKRQAPYDASVNPYAASQMQHMAAQRMQHNAGLNNFPGRPDFYPGEEENPYMSSKSEGHSQWGRDAPKVSDPLPSHSYNEGPGGNSSRSFYQGQISDPNLVSEKQGNKESSIQPHEQDMDIGYEENPLPSSFEGLEKKFLDEIMKLTKEQNDAEDVENARHREKIVEINMRYLEKLSSLRARHANLREEFLRKESQARLHQYQQAGMSLYPNNTGLSDAHGYGGAAAAAAAEDAHRAYAFESYRERGQFLGHGRTQGTEARVPYPGGRVYNTGGRYY